MNHCYYCLRAFGSLIGKNNTPLEKTDDHIVPISKGGKRHSLNIVRCCQVCNVTKSNLTLEEFEAKIDKWISLRHEVRGYTPEDLNNIKRKIGKLYKVRSGYETMLLFKGQKDVWNKVRPILRPKKSK